MAQVTTFAVNYKGRPYMQSLMEHQPLLWVLVGANLTLYACCLEMSSGLNEYLQLTPMPNSDFKVHVLCLMVSDLVAALVVEKVAALLFYHSACTNATDRLLV